MTTTEAARMIRDVAWKTGLTFAQCAKVVLSFEEAFADDDGPARERRIAMLQAALDVLSFYGDPVSIN
ncbi:MAG TPA: hypothetical protein VFE60_24570 [Roseiarcus sp.]|jgi:hypothetical protein|nr:hypothetical protein [Roseiarcus sp.]